MIRQNKDMTATHMRVTGDAQVTEIVGADDVTYSNSALKCNGGAYIAKGLRIGNQEKVVNGMLFYDGENFYGHSEKFGTCLLSNHTLSSELTLPHSIFTDMPVDGGGGMPSQPKKHVVTAVQNNLTKTSTHTWAASDPDEESASIAKRPIKNIIVDITMKDVNTFYMVIPQVYQTVNFHLNLEVTFHFDESTYINSASIYLMNQTNKPLSISFGNDERYLHYAAGFKSDVPERRVGKFELTRVTDQFLLLSSTFFSKERERERE